MSTIMGTLRINRWFVGYETFLWARGGGALIADVVAEDAVRKTSADIEEHLHALMPAF